MTVQLETNSVVIAAGAAVAVAILMVGTDQGYREIRIAPLLWHRPDYFILNKEETMTMMRTRTMDQR